MRPQVQAYNKLLGFLLFSGRILKKCFVKVDNRVFAFAVMKDIYEE